MKEGIIKYLEKGRRDGKKLNHYKMLEDITNLVETDFCNNMDIKSLPKSKPYTQKEAREMASLLGQIYLIAHCIHCGACQSKYYPPNPIIR